MGTGFNRAGQKGPDVLTGHCRAESGKGKEALQQFSEQGAFCTQHSGEMPQQELPSKKPEMGNLHMHQYCECNTLILLIMKNLSEGVFILCQKCYLHYLIQSLYDKAVGSWLFQSHFTGESVWAKRIYFICPRIFLVLNAVAKIKAQGCVTADLGSNPPVIKEITRKPLETLG